MIRRRRAPGWSLGRLSACLALLPAHGAFVHNFARPLRLLVPARRQEQCLHMSTAQATSSRSSIGGDVVVVGGGLAGLSVALELSNRGARVVVLNRDPTEAASLAAGGMLAPQAERLESGPYLDLCLQSRDMYPGWIEYIEGLAGGGHRTGFCAAGGFLAPAMRGDQLLPRWRPPPEGGAAYYLTGEQMRAMEPVLSSEVEGGWWFPEDMQVDARLLLATLKEACIKSQVSILEGKESAVEAVVFDPTRPMVRSLTLKNGRRVEADKVVIANGAWMNKLLPVPMAPIKGQMLSLRPTQGSEKLLSRVLFGEGCYVIPKSDGRIVVGATVEPEAGFDQRVTAGGLLKLTSEALRLCPALADWEVDESWAGLRPSTPDYMPVLGATPWENTMVAGGYWRNGVLLAPRTGQLVADAVEGRVQGSSADMLRHFSWNRFLSHNQGDRRGAGRVGRQQRVLASETATTPFSFGARQSHDIAQHTPFSSQTPIAHARREPSEVLREFAEASALRDAASQTAKRAMAPTPDGEEEVAMATEGRLSVEEFAASLGYDGSRPPPPKPGQAQSRAAYVGSGDTYEEIYANDGVALQKSGWKAKQESGAKQEEGSFDPYADFIKLRESVEREEVLREARRINREGSVAYGLEDDPLGRQVAAKFNVPSSDASNEWSKYDRAAEEGTDKEMARKLTRPVQLADDDADAEEDNDGGVSVEDFVSSLGYDYEDPRLAKNRVSEEKRQQARGPAPDPSQASPAAIPAAPAAKPQEEGSFDPYADYNKLRESVEREEVLREARRINREGSVAYGLDDDPLGRHVAARFNVPSSAMSNDWSRFDRAAEEGADRDMARKLTRPVQLTDGDEGEDEAEGPSVEDFVSSLGYDYEDPRLAKNRVREERRQQARTAPQPTYDAAAPAVVVAARSTQASPQQAEPAIQAATAPQPVVNPPPAPPAPETTKPEPQPSVAAVPSEPVRDGPRPPWAHEIDALYELVKRNQAELRRQQGMSVAQADAPPVVPFENTELTDEEVRALPLEKRLEMLEIFRANPDGTLTKVERGEGIPL